tara:strand:- start:265 stop:630 length:366 start_codon:yes stop_codon:yes gene_type:complete
MKKNLIYFLEEGLNKGKIEKTKLLVLTIIAINLTFLSISQYGLPITKAYATNGITDDINRSFIPINDDGSINIKLSEEQLNYIKPPVTTDVNISSIGNASASFFFVDDNGAFWLNTRNKRD